MTAAARAFLRSDASSTLHPHLPELPSSCRPSGMACERWRQEAELTLERCLADLDAALLSGEAPPLAALTAVDEWMSWVRRSVGALVRPEGREIVRGDVRQSFSLAWRLAADRAVADFSEDFEAVERFCGRYLDAAELWSRAGYAALIALRA